MKVSEIISKERGAAVVEFAVVVPLLLILVFGMIEFGILMYDKVMITNASREGARAGIVSGLTDRETKIATVVNGVIYPKYPNKTQSLLISFEPETDIVISTDPSTNLDDLEFDDDLTVIVDYDYTFLIFPAIVAGLFGGSSERGLHLQARTTMKVE